MGKLTYDSHLTADFDDRALAHIQIVIGAKLRRGECFYFSWRDDALSGGGRSTVWMHPGIALSYKFFGSKLPILNRAWIEALSLSADSSGGLQMVPEPIGSASVEPTSVRTVTSLSTVRTVRTGRTERTER